MSSVLGMDLISFPLNSIIKIWVYVNLSGEVVKGLKCWWIIKISWYVLVQVSVES